MEKMRKGLRGLFFRRQVQKEAEKGESTAITLSLPLVVALSLLLACAVAWSFFIGFMAGRGENPKEGIQSITGLPIAGDTKTRGAPPGSSAPENAAPSPPGGELAQSPAPAGAVIPEASTPFVASPGTAMVATVPAAASAVPQDVVKTPPAPRPAFPREPARKPVPRPTPGKGGQVYDFTWQVAAFRGMKDANAAMKMLEKNGLSPRLQKSGRVQLVVISMRGEDGDAAKLVQKLASLKLGHPLQLSKKPVQPKAAKRNKK